MKSDSSAPRVNPGLSAEAYQAFFEALENPAALCDIELTVLTANPAFELLCGVKSPVGRNLVDLLAGVEGAVPVDGSAADLDIQLRSGQSVTLTLSRRGQTLAVLARNLAQVASSGSLARAGRAMLEQARTEQALLQLGREVAGAMSEEELVAVVAKAVKDLFPGRTFCIRITEPRTGHLTSLYAEGRLRQAAPETVVIKRSAGEKTHLDFSSLAEGRVQMTEEEVPLMFAGSVRSVCAPLVASGQLFGVINIEYPEGMTADLVSDDRLLIQLANQVAVGIRNAKLIDELTFVRKYLEELLEHANALILVINRERKILVFNEQIAQLTGFPKEEVLGEDLLRFVPDSERMRMMRVTTASLRGEKVASFETRMLGRDGNEVRVSFATSAVLTARGEVEGVIAIGQDLTAMKELERQVIHAEKLASLGQVAASVVHEINNPMTAVAAYAEALLQKSLVSPNPDRSDQEKLRKVLENSHRILRFTQDLVSYARPARDKAEVVDVHRLLDAALSFCDHLVSQHGIQVEKQYGTLTPLPGVRGHLIQVFVNLITNACHATQSGGKIRLETRLEGSDAVVVVQDTGTGIGPEHLGKVFEPFFTTKPDGKGTGLGLAIVQSIVEKHGGAVTVESELGRGTAFTVRLPVP